MQNNNPTNPSEKEYFVLKLIPPRPTFAMDMTDAEKKIMQDHVGYWTGLLKQGIAIVFGPVFDPKGIWGLGVVFILNFYIPRTRKTQPEQ